MRAHIRPVAVALLFGVCACGPSLEDQVAQLATGRAGEDIRQALLLGKGRAVGPMLAALAAGGTSAAGRVALIEVLAGLAMRVDDKRIPEALFTRLKEDSEPAVRAVAGRQLGLYRIRDSVDLLIGALSDDDGAVRLAAAVALGQVENRWTEAHAVEIGEHMRRLTKDENAELRTEVLISVETRIQEFIVEAKAFILSSQLASAESTLTSALEYSPQSLRARYRMGRFYLDETDPSRGIDMLREYGMLIDVPRLRAPPTIDGKIGEGEWVDAAKSDRFFALSTNHPAPVPTDIRIRVLVGATDEGLYVGWICYDDTPSEIVTRATQDDDRSPYVWQEDRIELHLDHEFRHIAPFHLLAVNPLGFLTDLVSRGSGSGDDIWDGDVESETSVGEDRWTVELLLRYDDTVKAPAAGTMWGVNFVRSFRGSEYVQWVRTYPNGLVPDDFGILRF